MGILEAAQPAAGLIRASSVFDTGRILRGCFGLSRPPALEAKFAKYFNGDSPILFFEKIVLYVNQKMCISFAVPLSHEGRFAIVTDVESGMRWTDWRAGRAMLMRTAKACGPGTPGLVLSLSGDDLAGDGD